MFCSSCDATILSSIVSRAFAWRLGAQHPSGRIRREPPPPLREVWWWYRGGRGGVGVYKGEVIKKQSRKTSRVSSSAKEVAT